MGKTYSTEELVSRWEDQRYMKNLMGKYANCMIYNKEHDRFERFWSKKREDLSLSFNDRDDKGE